MSERERERETGRDCVFIGEYYENYDNATRKMTIDLMLNHKFAMTIKQCRHSKNDENVECYI